MARAEIIAVIALVVSIISLGSSIYFNYRDRAHLKTTSRFHAGHPEYGPPHISVTIMNAGRRPIILRMWAGSDKEGHWVGSFLGEGKSGLRLGENERHDLSLEKNDLVAATPTDDVLFEDLWVEDSLGRRHPIKDAKANVKKLWSA